MASSPGGKLRLNALAVLRLITKLKFGRLHDRQVRGLRALEDAANIDTSQPISLGDARSVAHQAASFGPVALEIDRRHPMVGRQRNDLYATVADIAASRVAAWRT